MYESEQNSAQNPQNDEETTVLPPEEPVTGTDEPASRPPLRKLAEDLFEILELFVCCAAVLLTLFTFVARPTVVEGPSMEDTLVQGDTLIIASLGYEPKAGDIVVAQNVSLALYPEPIVKRVIATGGQTIDIDFTTWTVTVDGVEIDEPYRKVTAERLRTSDWSFPMEIPEGYVFVMGDNRNHSADSRSADIGLIDERCIVGKAVLRVLPLSRFTLFD